MLVISDLAEQDLIDIWLYIAQDQPLNADAFLDRLNDRAHQLAEFPEMGVERPELGLSMKSFAVGRYILFYRIVNQGIELVRVLASARDISSLFE